MTSKNPPREGYTGRRVASVLIIPLDAPFEVRMLLRAFANPSLVHKALHPVATPAWDVTQWEMAEKEFKKLFTRLYYELLDARQDYTAEESVKSGPAP